MGEMVRRQLVLTGARTGQTKRLGGLQYIEGKYNFVCDEDDVKNFARYHGRVYKAFLAGTPELDEAQRADAANPALQEMLNGKRTVQTRTQRRRPDEVRAPVQPSGGGSAPVSPDVGGGADDDPSTAEGSVSGGDGQSDPGIPGAAAEQNGLLETVMSLDPTLDEHWTEAGKPRVDVVAEKCGNASVTRAMIEKAAPGYTRGAASR